ncbi:MAG: hypothetical protein E6Q97_20460 [Desulfurellales bacterium]|nr:MAG: hypothetical protein E6Q97_20460 [Desulfurellales bacterium]
MSLSAIGSMRAVLELGVQLNHAMKSENPDVAKVETAMANVLREIPTTRRNRVAFHIVRASVRQLLKDFILESGT